MEANQTEILEQKMSRIATMAVWFQCVAFVGALSILYFRLPGYKDLGRDFSLTALIASFILARVYINNGKKLEAIKRFSPEEAEIRKREYFTKFFSAYALWILFSGIFAYA
ncbi:MAG: hypothetical protein KBA81_04140 [Rhabdochlamydiaceae bacterium]|nr:hypothetical protein [Rhabdochlamydiaceae bacterium]